MPSELFYLALTAASISLIHTVTGPDHYLPFIALSKSRAWTVRRTVFWTVICGLGHVGSSVLVAFGGFALGWSLSKITWLENIRGGAAAWAMLIMGTAYCLYAGIRLFRNKAHKHFETDGNNLYVFEHRHGTTVLPQHKTIVTPWIMFIVFVLGPCEPLIPLLSYPAATHSPGGIILLLTVFTLFTIGAMVAMVLMGFYGLSLFNQSNMEQYSPVLAGITILVCGFGMLYMGW